MKITKTYNGKEYAVSPSIHHITTINGKQMVLCHDDDCNAPLTRNGYPDCGFHPDMQSQCFIPIEEEDGV